VCHQYLAVLTADRSWWRDGLPTHRVRSLKTR